MSDPSFTSTNYTPDRLIGGDHKLVTREVVLTDGDSEGALARGAVLGFDPVSGKYSIVNESSSWPAGTARAILAKDADPSGGDVSAVIYDEGEFNEDELSFGGTVDADDVREGLRALGIHLKSPVSA